MPCHVIVSAGILETEILKMTENYFFFFLEASPKFMLILLHCAILSKNITHYALFLVVSGFLINFAWINVKILHGEARNTYKTHGSRL